MQANLSGRAVEAHGQWQRQGRFVLLERPVQTGLKVEAEFRPYHVGGKRRQWATGGQEITSSALRQVDNTMTLVDHHAGRAQLLKGLPMLADKVGACIPRRRQCDGLLDDARSRREIG